MPLPVASSESPPSSHLRLSGRRSASARAVLGIVVAPNEIERTAWLFGLLFLAALVLVVGRTARDALFLTKFPVSWVAPLWIAYAAVSSLTAIALAPLFARTPRLKLVFGFVVLSVTSYGALRLLIAYEVRSAYVIFYVWSEVIANLTSVLVWTIAQDLHDPQSAKRLFGLIGSGRAIGTLVCGFLTGSLVGFIGTENLILVLMGAFVAIGLITVRLNACAPLPQPLARTLRAPTSRGKGMSVMSSPYMLATAAMTLLLFTMLTVGDYQFKAIARAEFADKDSLARYFASFYGIVGMVGIVVQLLVTPRLLQRFGVAAGMLAMPASFTVASAGLLFFPNVGVASILKGSDNALQFTIHDATMQLLFFPIPVAQRERARTTIGAVVKPLGYALGAVLLMVITPAATASLGTSDVVQMAASLGFFTLPLGVLVLLFIPLVRRGYVDAMRRTLVRRDIDTDDLAMNASAVKLLAEALHSPDSPQVLFALDRLRQAAPDDVRDALAALVQHASSDVRAAALRVARELEHADAAAWARVALNDAHEAVRVEAVQTLAASLCDDAHDELATLARSAADAGTRTAAIAALVRYCGLDGMLDGAPRLRELLDSGSAADRIEAARVLGKVGEASLFRALARLITDPDARVRRAAVEASVSVRDVRLLPLLVAALSDRAVDQRALTAITALGPLAVPELGRLLSDPSTPRASRLRIPRSLARIDTQAALAVLLDHLAEPDAEVRQKILASASRLRLACGGEPLAAEVVRPHIDREMAEQKRERDAYLGARRALGRPLLDAYILSQLRKGIVRILRFCELAYPREVVASVRAHLFGSDVTLRANAFEVLEALLDHVVRRRLIDLVERFHGLRQAASIPPQASASPAEQAAAYDWLQRQIALGDAYLTALLFDAVAYRGLRRAAPLALAALSHPDPFVRENAAIAVAVSKPEGAEGALAKLAEDPDPVVSTYAKYWQATHSAGIDPHDAMYTTIERVLFLQRIPVFSHVSGEALVPLARGSAVISAAKNEVLFRQGEPGGALYLVISGAVALSVDGREVARLGPDDVFGEMSIFDSEPRTANAEASEESELLAVSAQDFLDAVRDNGDVAVAVIQVLNRRLREADKRLAAYQTAADPDGTRRPPATRWKADSPTARAIEEADLE